MLSQHEYEEREALEERLERARAQANRYLGNFNPLDNAWVDYCEANGLDACSLNYIHMKTGFYAGYVMGRHARLGRDYEIPARTRTEHVVNETAEAGGVENVSKAEASRGG